MDTIKCVEGEELYTNDFPVMVQSYYPKHRYLVLLKDIYISMVRIRLLDIIHKVNFSGHYQVACVAFTGFL